MEDNKNRKPVSFTSNLTAIFQTGSLTSNESLTRRKGFRECGNIKNQKKLRNRATNAFLLLLECIRKQCMTWYVGKTKLGVSRTYIFDWWPSIIWFFLWFPSVQIRTRSDRSRFLRDGEKRHNVILSAVCGRESDKFCVIRVGRKKKRFHFSRFTLLNVGSFVKIA